MNATRILVASIGWLVLGGAMSLLPGQTAGSTLEQELRSQFPLTQVGANGVVVRAGTVLAIQQDGITALPSPGEYPCNTYKPTTHIRQAGFCEMNYSTTKAGQIRLQVGAQVYLTAVQFKPTEIVFKLQTVSDNDTPYRAAVAFQFSKGFQDSMKLKEVQDTIAQLLAPAANSPAQGSSQPTSNQAPNAQPGSTSETFVNAIGGQTQLNSDGTFVYRIGGRQATGHYTTNGDTTVLTFDRTGQSNTYRRQGDKIYDTMGNVVATRLGSAPPAPTASLSLPATYMSAQAPTDQIQLNADHSFSLQEGGQAYHGTFAVNGSSLELTISESNTKTTATLQGNNLMDSSGQTWTRAEQPAGSPPSPPALQNEDVIKMVKAGLDDATVLAKISNSKCQFDTSTDALIKLKQSGVSPAVLKAMVGAGK